MTSHRREKIDDLRVDQALVGLSVEDKRELARLMVEEEMTDDASFDLAAAALTLAGLSAAEDELPKELAERIERDAREHLAVAARSNRGVLSPRAADPSRTRKVSQDRRSTTAAGAQVVVMARPEAQSTWSHWSRWGGWVAAAAAACVVVAEHLGPMSPPSVARALSTDARVITVDAAVNAASARARGTLTWTDASGRGQLRLRGLPSGDYELWIDDAARGERHPLAAGTLTVTAGAEAVAEVAPAIAPRAPVGLRVTGVTNEGRDAATVVTIPLTGR